MADLPPVFVTDSALQRSVEILSSAQGSAQPPGVVFWLGFDCEERCCVSTVLVPEKAPVELALATAISNEEVFETFVNASLVFLGEVRVFGEDDESDEDIRRNNLRFYGAISIDVPTSQNFDLDSCRIHRRLEEKWVRVPIDEVHRHLRIISSFRDLRFPA